MYSIKHLNGDICEEDSLWILNNIRYVSIDTETTGLDPLKDNLCIIQMYAHNKVFIIKYNKDIQYTNLIKVLKSNKVTKIFHHANFDLRFLMKNLNCVEIKNVVCTKIAAKLVRGVDSNNSLKALLKEYFDIEIDKSQQLSDWSKSNLTDEQIEYAINDTLYLSKLWDKLYIELEKKDCLETVFKCYEYLPTNSMLQNKGIENIFVY